MRNKVNLRSYQLWKKVIITTRAVMSGKACSSVREAARKGFRLWQMQGKTHFRFGFTMMPVVGRPKEKGNMKRHAGCSDVQARIKVGDVIGGGNQGRKGSPFLYSRCSSGQESHISIGGHITDSKGSHIPAFQEDFCTVGSSFYRSDVQRPVEQDKPKIPLRCTYQQFQIPMSLIRLKLHVQVSLIYNLYFNCME
ncbi:hypothetical protein NPIL_683691 [Nephila pilipes]|uniref:Uncharacterized protein n=1 Tax=Nephila pilipes TaxID=299642 RepID=A0A8X6NYX3_NEPPI|nr:hypothetical protein NPIL_683691 [Nephila pilipes]